jgi:GT2 family glycosyltransferase
VATAVLDLELSTRPREISGLDGYDRAFALVRLHGRPVGQALFAVAGGRVAEAELDAGLLEVADENLWRAWIAWWVGWTEPASAGLDPPAASVVVCTRDRPDDLRVCVEALTRLDHPPLEVVVVDNRPATSSTVDLVRAFPGVRYVREDRPGASAARNRGLREARGEVVAFTDDDAVPDPAWLGALLTGFDDPLVLCVTGLTMPRELETRAQEWSERHSPFGRGFRRAVFDHSWHDPLHASPMGASVNMALRRSVPDLVGLFDEALGPGTPSCSGEDHELFTRILARGYRVVYEPSALCWHRHRRTWEDLRRMVFGYGAGVYAAWTRELFVEGELGLPRLAWGWLRHDQAPALARALLRRPGSVPLDLVLAELRGCAAGPWRYLAGRRRLRRLERAA